MPEATPHESTGALAPPTTAPEPALLRIGTRSRDVAEFITCFCRLVDQHHLLIMVRTPRPSGALVRFSIHLADGEAMFQGDGEIVDVQEPRAGRSGWGTRIRIGELDKESQTMHRCLLMARDGRTPFALAQGTSPQEAADRRAPRSPIWAAALEALGPSAGAAALELPPPPRAMLLVPATSQLPANPFAEIPDDVLEQLVDGAIGEAAPATMAPPLLAPAAAPAEPVTPVTPPAPFPPGLLEPGRSGATLRLTLLLASIIFLVLGCGIGVGYLLWGR